MADIFREVDEAMRQERLEKFWTENRPYIIGFIVGTILLTGIISGYRAWDHGVKEAQTAQLIALQDAENYPQNLLAADDLELRSGLRGIALLQGATAALDDDNNQDALTLYNRAANDKAIPADLRQIATLMAVRLELKNETAPEKAKQLAEKLEAIIASKTIWSAHAKIDAAAIYANLLDNPARAAELVSSVGESEKLPESLLLRANALSQHYKSQIMQETSQDKTQDKTEG